MATPNAHDWDEIGTLTVEDVRVSLQFNRAGGEFRLVNGAVITALTPAEATELERSMGSALGAAQQRSPYDVVDARRSARFQRDLDALRRNAEGAVLLDTTTVHNMESLVTASVVPTAVPLLDLAAVTSALVMWDKAVVLNGGGVFAERVALHDLLLAPADPILRDTL